ncbi:MAG: ankyrin repeat domain-containing protein [Wolbachia sp.]
MVYFNKYKEVFKKEHKITYEEWKQKIFNENHLFSVCARARASRFAKTIKYTLLHVAIFSGRLDIVKHLIADKKANVDARGSDDKTALHLAASNGHLDTVKYFVDEKNVDVNQPNNDGNTALHLAAENGNTEIVKVLLNAKTDPLLKNKNGKTPRDLATDENVKQLLEEAENKRVADRENVHSIPNEHNNKPCADGANILHSTKGISCLL